MIIAALSIFPVGEGTSLSKYVKASLNALEATDLKINVGGMATTIEAETLDEVFRAVKKAHGAQVELGAKRVYLVLTIDDRKDKEATAEKKLKAVGYPP